MQNIVGSFQNYKSVADKKKEITSKVFDGQSFIHNSHDLAAYTVSLILFIESLGVKMSPYPIVDFTTDDKYSNDLLGLTGNFLDEQGIFYIWTTGRHVKDIMRSVAHELVHHNQYLNGVTLSSSEVEKYNDPYWEVKEIYLKEWEEYSYMEGDAFLRGNMLFRSWTDAIKQGLVQL